MSVLRGMSTGVKKVSEMVMEMFPNIRGRMTAEEQALAGHLRGNEGLYDALTELIRFRMQARDRMAVPSDPLVCKGILERQNELRWLLSRLEAVYRSPANPQSDKGEQPAE